jgi:hypothetical protein
LRLQNAEIKLKLQIEFIKLQIYKHKKRKKERKAFRLILQLHNPIVPKIKAQEKEEWGLQY